MLLIAITFALVAVGVIAYWIGALQLARYAARVSTGLAVAVVVFPPVTFWFAFYRLEQEGKEGPIATWLFGFISTLLMIAVFCFNLGLFHLGLLGRRGAGDPACQEAVQRGLGEDDPVGDDHVVGVQLIRGEDVHTGDVAQRARRHDDEDGVALRGAGRGAVPPRSAHGVHELAG